MEEGMRVRLPRERDGELFGIIEEKLGASRFKIACKDGVMRVCRIPGRFRKMFKFRVGDVVIVKPWDIEKDKGDIVFIYNRTQIGWLRRKGYL